MPSFHNHPPEILIVEDDAGDQVLIQEALRACPLSKQVRVVNDGVEAMEYLTRSGRFTAPAETARPTLILLDVNMPRLNGKQLAARLKGDPALKPIPAVAFSTSNREEDVAECYAAGVNSYVQKPADFDRFQAVLTELARYWLATSLPPPVPPAE